MYPLYHTLNKKLKKRDLSAEERKELIGGLSRLKEDEKNPVIMLIVEHSKIADGTVFDSANIVLPYGVEQKGKNVVISLDKLPIPLKWILWKFVNRGKN